MENPALLIASDHAGFSLKEHLVKAMPHFKWEDLGPHDSARVDYPDFAARVAKKVAESNGTQRGILICGSGQGMAMAANRFAGVRAALGWNTESVLLARSHNDANVLCLGSRLLGGASPDASPNALAETLIKLFLTTGFDGGRHRERIEKIDRISGCS